MIENAKQNIKFAFVVNKIIVKLRKILLGQKKIGWAKSTKLDNQKTVYFFSSIVAVENYQYFEFLIYVCSKFRTWQAFGGN